MYKENVICQREVCLPAAEAFTFTSPAGRLGELSHSIKAFFILDKLLSRDRALSFPFTAFHHSISSTLQFGKKNIYASVKYDYEGPKNGQTVVLCSTATRFT